jgi:hypothetical protein
VNTYRKALDEAIREYEALAAQRQETDKRLAEVAQSIGTLTRLCGLVPTVPWGLTDACRVVLRGAGVPMTPSDVRDRLQEIGFDLSKYASELAAIHTTLKRLNHAGELKFLRGAGAKPQYIWVRPARAASLGPEVAAYLGERDASAPPRSKKSK